MLATTDGGISATESTVENESDGIAVYGGEPGAAVPGRGSDNDGERAPQGARMEPEDVGGLQPAAR